MLIPDHIQQKLQSNWGERAESMICHAECRLFLQDWPRWEWFVYAQDPDDLDKLIAVERRNTVIPNKILSLEDIKGMFDHMGELLQFDTDFMPRNVGTLWQQLKKRYPYEIERHS